VIRYKLGVVLNASSLVLISGENNNELKWISLFLVFSCSVSEIESFVSDI